MTIYNYYKIGGSLSYKHPTYVERQADWSLYKELKYGNFCYVLNSRQMGKSSLRVRMVKTLNEEGIQCASIDVTRLGRHITQEKWYFGFLNELLRSLNLPDDVNSYLIWWHQYEFLSPIQRLSHFIEEKVLVDSKKNIVIFIDEIDSIIKFEFKDEFFAWIRSCYNQRSDNPEYNRLTFCLLGVATPSSLISDKEITAFNIGRAIELTGFTVEEAELALTPGLHRRVDNPKEALVQILRWTGGQPFLTQKLCQLIAQETQSGKPSIDQLVQTFVIDNWEFQDDPVHLRSIQNRILSNEQRASRLLGLYQEILKCEEVNADSSSEQVELRLSGLVVEKHGKLKVYNRIYELVFDQDWVEAELAKLRIYSQAFTAWVASQYQDKSRLLRGQSLREAQAWAADKSLSDLDYRFLNTSQEAERLAVELEKLEAQTNLEIERKQRESEQAANQILAEANRKAKQRIRLGAFILIVSWLGAAMAGLLTFQAVHRQPEVLNLDTLLYIKLHKYLRQQIIAPVHNRAATA